MGATQGSLEIAPIYFYGHICIAYIKFYSSPQPLLATGCSFIWFLRDLASMTLEADLSV